MVSGILLMKKLICGTSNMYATEAISISLSFELGLLNSESNFEPINLLLEGFEIDVFENTCIKFFPVITQFVLFCLYLY